MNMKGSALRSIELSGGKKLRISHQSCMHHPQE